ncbi:hypothetical protein CC2G_000177 [Coprinopsis cinerea AmutBmut pab1-1]|nr:hypothetical protein CC2G_000177 [Coprinopsis cinerea AmutBmut pab1-1]
MAPHNPICTGQDCRLVSYDPTPVSRSHHNAAIADGEAVTPQSALSNNRYDCLIPCIAFFLPVRFLYDHQLPSSSSSIIAIFAFQRLSHASLVSVFNHRNTTTSQLYDIPYAPYHAFYGLVDYH